MIFLIISFFFQLNIIIFPFASPINKIFSSLEVSKHVIEAYSARYYDLSCLII